MLWTASLQDGPGLLSSVFTACVSPSMLHHGLRDEYHFWGQGKEGNEASVLLCHSVWGKPYLSSPVEKPVPTNGP